MSARISVIVPAKNEAGSIGPVLDGVLRYADEVILVDGHSTDRTVELAREKGITVVRDSGRGKGAGLRRGIDEATGDILVFIDGDGSHEPADIPNLAAPIVAGDADLVIGSRLLGGSEELHGNLSNYLRMVGAGFITLIINLRWKQELTDVENGFRAVSATVARKLDLRADDFDIEQEMVMNALRRGCRVREVPSHEFKRSAGCSKLPTWKGFKFLWRLFLGLFR
ncbi:glycosyltransferase family 2 protein [bacterium]|nr:glycosyltransferase family 2 protein [candidate division CSSED10-310 bacterium]